MADTVRYLLEEMVPELEDMEQRGYFSRQEIKQIVQKRQDFECNLKRRAALKEDYLRYVEYESRLEELRQHRRKERGITGKKSLADYCITRRIHFIYERATRKFRGDLALWSRWLSFCQRSGSARQMSRALTKALKLHPTAPALWTYAAAWEFEHNLNASAARALMQRGLRMCKDAPALWHEYFRMELLYAMRLRERRRVLGIGGADPTENDENGKEGGEGEEASGDVDESAAAVQAVLNGAVAAVVYRSAIKAVPGSVEFRSKFLGMLRPFDFPGKAALQELVYGSISQDFADSPQAWDLRARRSLDGAAEAVYPEAVQTAMAVYTEAVQVVPSTEMYSLFTEFLREQLQGVLIAEAEGQASQGTLQAQGVGLARKLQEVYSQAAEGGQLTEAMGLEWPKLLARCGDPSGALAAAHATVQVLPRSVAAWQQLLALEACQLGHAQLAGANAPAAGESGAVQHGNGSDSQSSSDAEGTASPAGPAGRRGRQLESLVLQGLRSVGVEGSSSSLWLAGVQVLAACQAPLDGLCRALLEAVAGLARGPVQGGMGAVAAAVLAAVKHRSGLPAARELYRALLKLPPAGGELMHAVLDLELTAAGGTGCRPGKPLPARQLREAFEAAVGAYGGQDWKLWLRYMQYEQQSSKGAGQVYWRAIKALEDPEPLIAECQLLNLN